jgi:phosphoglycerate dehydrogenase-like enzyme
MLQFVLEKHQPWIFMSTFSNGGQPLKMSQELSVVTDFPFDESDQQIIREAIGTSGRLEIVHDIAALRHTLPHTDILCTFRLPNDILALAPRLRWLQYPGAGIDNFSTQDIILADLPFTITTANEATADATAEFVLALMFGFARKLADLYQLQQRREWATGRVWGALRGFELQGKTIGIIGMGTIGKAVAQRCQALGLRVLGIRRSSKRGERDNYAEYYETDGLCDFLGECDFVLLCVPLVPATISLIDEHELHAMRPNAYLINVSRGQVINERVLIRALRERWIAGAALDVTIEEPLPTNSPLWSLADVTITPHLSAMTTGYSRRVATIFANNIQRFIAGDPLLHQVDHARGY